MQSRLVSSKFVLAVCLLVPAVSAQALDVSVDCAKKSLAVEVGKLNKLAANKVQISGNCNEDIVVDGHVGLTLVGNAGASISATVFDPNDPGSSTTALAINASNVTVQDLTLNGGANGAVCENRSTCIFRDVTVQGGHNGLGAQGQSAIDIIGASSIVDSLNTGVGAYGASSINIRPTWANGFDGTELGPVISGHGEFGAFAQDGSFLRADSVTFSGNATGVWAQRNATIKIFANQSGASVSDNWNVGVGVMHGSVGQLGINFSDNALGTTGPATDDYPDGNYPGWAAIAAGPLSYVTVSGSTCSGNGANISTSHASAVVQGTGGAPTCN